MLIQLSQQSNDLRYPPHLMKFGNDTWYAFNRLNNTILESLVEENQEELEKGQKLYCFTCRNAITSQQERIYVQGQHTHVFENPQGISYRIGCFDAACGCTYLGPKTNEFTWFRGYEWQIALCNQCGIHTGWQYVSHSGNCFHGLILDRLIAEI